MRNDAGLGPSKIAFAVEDPASEDAMWCLSQYFRELDARFDDGFNPAESLPAEVEEIRLPRGMLIVARREGAPVGCGALKLHGAWAELKRMWIAPDARGLGIGRRILLELEQRAIQNGASLIRLETNKTLVEAISLYRKSGYREVRAFNSETYADHWFEKQLPDLGTEAPR
jgi:ribosomal protein S18 acetylase RimI-like enzyme